MITTIILDVAKMGAFCYAAVAMYKAMTDETNLRFPVALAIYIILLALLVDFGLTGFDFGWVDW